MMDLVSICIPSYKPDFFRECLTSAIAQTYANVEIIVSDDCPDTAIEDICSKYSGLVTYVRNPNPGLKGVNNVYNLCRLAKGKYIKFLLDDDILHPFCVQYLVEIMEMGAPQGAVLAFSPRGIINEANAYASTINMFNVESTSIVPGHLLIASIATTLLNPVGELTTVLLRRDQMFDAAGEPSFLRVDREQWRGLGDVAAWLNMGLRGPAVIHPFVLSYFRQHAGSNSNPTYNSDLIAGVTDWEKVILFAEGTGALAGESLRCAYEKLVERYKGWLPIYPQLESDIRRLEPLAAMPI